MEIAVNLVLLCSVLVTLSEALQQSGFYADNGLQQTVMLEKLPGKEKKEMQQEILTLLGLHHRPKPISVATHNSAPKFMIDLYRSMQYGDSDLRETNTDQMQVNISLGSISYVNKADMVMSFVNHGRKGRKVRHEGKRRFFFDFSEVPIVETVEGAEMRLYKFMAKRKWMRKSSFVLSIYMIQQGQDLEDKLLILQSNMSVDGDYQGWLELNVTDAARAWTYNPRSNLGLFMTITDINGNNINPHALGIVGRRGPEDYQPFLVAFFKMVEKVHVRKTRSTRRRQRADVSYKDDKQWTWKPQNKYTRKACQKRKMYVQFRDLGWQEWIIAPDGYAAFYCAGECAFPLNQNMNATNHAIVQTLVHLMNPFGVPKPCCAPTKLSAISVLYFDNNSNVILKKYRNMVVRSCGCH